MGGMKDKRQEPGKGREEQGRPQKPGQHPVNPEEGMPSRGNPSRGGQRPEEMERRREDDLLQGEEDI